MTIVPGLSEVFEEDCGYRLHVQVTLEPVDTELDARRADVDVDGIPMDLDRARMRRDAGRNVALEVTGRLLPRIVETVRRVLW